jgi:hypothetical protein
MEFTKDDYVVDGDFDVTVEYNDGMITPGDADKVIIKGDWAIIEHTSGVSVINREVIQSIDIDFKEG